MPLSVWLRRATALLAVGFFALAGLGFAAASLLLARALPKAEFGELTVAVMLLGVFTRLAPLGQDGVLHHRRLDYGRPLLLRGVLTSSACALLACGLAIGAYGLAPDLTFALFGGVICGGLTHLAAGKFQSQKRLSWSLPLNQSSNLTLLLAAWGVVALDVRSLCAPLWIVTLGYVLTGSLAWSRLARERIRESGPFEPCPWGDALSFAGVAGAVLVLSQLERALLPRLVSLEAVALFGVVASIVIAPYRTVQLAIHYTLLPRLTLQRDRGLQRRLLVREGALFAAIACALALAAWLATPALLRLCVGDKYAIDGTLLCAAIAGGTLRVLGAFSRASAEALCKPADRARVNVWMWIALGVGSLAALPAAQWGIVGVVWAVNLAWLLSSAVAAGFALRPVREGPGVRPVQATA